MKKAAFFSFFIFSAFLLFPARSFADSSSQGFSISPASQEVAVDGSQKEADFSIDITNNAGYSATFSLSTRDFGAMDELGGVSFKENPDDKYGLASWISLDEDSVTLAVGEKKTVHAAIKNSEKLSPGGHYAAIVFKMADGGNEKNDNSSKVALSPSIASLIFAKKIGGEIYGLSLENQEAKSGLFSLPHSDLLHFQNTGNTQVVPRGAVDIFDPLGREVKRGIINAESSMVLPETFRVIPVELKESSFAFLPGRYKLIVQYRYDGKDDFVKVEQSFYCIPVIALVSILVLGGLTGGIVWAVRLRKQR